MPRQKVLYQCGICGTDYSAFDKAEECEKNHKLLYLKDMKGSRGAVSMSYKPITMKPDGFPTKIVLRDGKEQAAYKRI